MPPKQAYCFFNHLPLVANIKRFTFSSRTTFSIWLNNIKLFVNLPVDYSTSFKRFAWADLSQPWLKNHPGRSMSTPGPVLPAILYHWLTADVRAIHRADRLFLLFTYCTARTGTSVALLVLQLLAWLPGTPPAPSFHRSSFRPSPSFSLPCLAALSRPGLLVFFFVVFLDYFLLSLLSSAEAATAVYCSCLSLIQSRRS